MSVKFCVVTSDVAAAREIANIAKPIANTNPYGREIVERGGAGFPAEQDILKWASQENIPNPGAIILGNDGSLSSVLSISDAKNAAMIEGAFVDAA